MFGRHGRLGASEGLLDECLIGKESLKLFGFLDTGEGPEASADSAGHDDGIAMGFGF